MPGADISLNLLASITAIAAGAVASVAGFGIGSILTPVLSLSISTKLAVAAVSIPHFIGSAIRCWTLRKDIDKKVLAGFGTASAVGGLVGALFYRSLESPHLTLIFGGILIFSGLSGISGFSERVRFPGPTAWFAGFLSGTLGGLVGNQGGIRSAAMLNFRLGKQQFVATATAIGLIVDTARMPMYIATQHQELLRIWPTIACASFGICIGTVAGMKLLKKIDDRKFKRIVSVLVLALGIWCCYQSVSTGR